MRRLIVAWLDNAKSVVEGISEFNGLLNQLQDVGLWIFEYKMKAIFLHMTFAWNMGGACSLTLK